MAKKVHVADDPKAGILAKSLDIIANHKSIVAAPKTFVVEPEDHLEEVEDMPEGTDDHGKRIPWSVMGVCIGTATGWDMADTFAMTIYSVELNETGLKWLPGLKPDWTMPNNFVDLGIDFDQGTVAIYDPDGTEWIQETHWEVFNQKQHKGWSPK